jgi:hypothetical protein
VSGTAGAAAAPVPDAEAVSGISPADPAGQSNIAAE